MARHNDYRARSTMIEGLFLVGILAVLGVFVALGASMAWAEVAAELTKVTP